MQASNTHCMWMDQRLGYLHLTRLDLTKQQNILSFLCTETIESKAV